MMQCNVLCRGEVTDCGISTPCVPQPLPASSSLVDGVNTNHKPILYVYSFYVVVGRVVMENVKELIILYLLLYIFN